MFFFVATNGQENLNLSAVLNRWIPASVDMFLGATAMVNVALVSGGEILNIESLLLNMVNFP